MSTTSLNSNTFSGTVECWMTKVSEQFKEVKFVNDGWHCSAFIEQRKVSDYSLVTNTGWITKFAQAVSDFIRSEESF